MGIKDFVNDYKYPLLALAFVLIVYGFFLQNITTFSKITGFATVGPAGSLSSSTYSCSRTSVSWSKPTTYPSGVTIYYIVWYSVYSNFPSSSTLSTSPSTSRSKTLSGLAPGVKYYWKVYSYPSNNFWAGSYSSYRSFTQSCKPSTPVATALNCHSEQITWTAPTGGGVSGYLVALSTSSTLSNPWLYYPSPVTATTFTFTGLNANTPYYARVAGYATISGKNYYDTSGTVGFVTTTCGTPTCNIRCVSCLTLQNEDCSYSYNYEGCRSYCSCSAGCIGCNRWRQADCREVDNAACWKLCPSPYYWPTTDTAVSTYFGEGGHRGIDIDGHVGDAVYAITTGTIVGSRTTCASGTETGTSPSIGCEGCGAGAVGNCVKILHTDGMYSVYGHLSTVSVISGTVLKGDTIGAIGNSGTSYGGHLHLEIWSSSSALLNPCDYLDKC